MDSRVIEEYKFNGVFDWLIHFTPVAPLWKNQPTYLIAQCSYLLGGLLTCLHAFRSGGRLRYLWLGTILHGLCVESLSYILPDVDNFWHSQTPLMLLGRRLPLHIILVYPCFIYQASIAAAQLKLPKWAEPFAVGLLVVLIDAPYDIASVKFVHWTWHDTDPNIGDRHYWVPWNSYYFHLTFAASFTFWFHTSRRWFDKRAEKWECSRRDVEVLSMVISAVLGPIGGILMFIPIYHPLHDIYNIHSEVTFFIMFSIALLFVWTGRDNPDKGGSFSISWGWLPMIALIVHYSVFLGITIFGHPEREVSVGLHEPIGPCDKIVPIRTVFGMVLKKKEFLCPTDYDEQYFDFRCVPGGFPKGKAKWYKICGKPYENRAEYITVIASITMVAFGVFRNIYTKNKNSQIVTKHKHQ